MSAKSRKRRKQGRGGPSDSAADDRTVLLASPPVEPDAVSEGEHSPDAHFPSQPPNDPQTHTADLGADDADLGDADLGDADLGLDDEILLAFLGKNAADEGSLVPVSSSHPPTQALPPDWDSPIDLDTLLPNPDVEQRRRRAQRLAAGVLAFAGLLGGIAVARGSEQPPRWPHERSMAATSPELPTSGVTAATRIALPAEAATTAEAQEPPAAAPSTAEPLPSAEHAMFENDAGTVTPPAEMVAPSAQ